MVYRAFSPICNSKRNKIIVYDWPRVSTMDKENTLMKLPGQLEVCNN